MQRINDNPPVYVVQPGDTSPLCNHGAMEIGVNTDMMIFFVHELMVVTYGTEGIINSCKKYSNTPTQ
jgi:hypothetical protein